MNKIAACLDLEHVDFATEFQVLLSLLSSLLNLLPAFLGDHVEVLDVRERGAHGAAYKENRLLFVNAILSLLSLCWDTKVPR